MTGVQGWWGGGGVTYWPMFGGGEVLGKDVFWRGFYAEKNQHFGLCSGSLDI